MRRNASSAQTGGGGGGGRQPVSAVDSRRKDFHLVREEWIVGLEHLHGAFLSPATLLDVDFNATSRRVTPATTAVTTTSAHRTPHSVMARNLVAWSDQVCAVRRLDEI